MKISAHALQRAAAHWIFAGLVLAMIAGNEGWTVGPLSVGQIVSWVNDAAAVVLVVGRFWKRTWVPLLIAGTLAAKVLTIAGVAPAQSDLMFDAGLGVLFCAAGAIIVSERPGIVYRQLLLIAAVSIPLMLVQMTGLAPWSETLNTEHTEDAPEPQPTLFVSHDDLHYRTAQARPSGFTHSNNFLSLLAVFAVALHFSRLKTPWLTWRDAVVVVFAILTMAKVSLLVLALVLLWKFITGVRLERRRILRVSGFALGVLITYAVLFPGLFAANTALYKVSYSFFIRVNDIVNMLPEGSGIKSWLVQVLEGTPKAPPRVVSLSGYAQIFAVLPYVVVAAMLVVPLFLRALWHVKRRYPHIVDATVLAWIVVIVYPAAVPMFRAQIFWFIAGFALLPFVLVWEPRRFRGTVGLLWPASRHPELGEVAR